MAQTKKSSRAAKTPPKEAIIEAALRLMALQGWRDTSLKDIAAEANITLAVMRAEFSGKQKILTAIMAGFDVAMIDDLDPEIVEDPVRDRLFDVVMRRFDVLEPHKEAIKNLIADLSRDPAALACFMAGPMRRSVRWMLEAAHVEPWGPLQPIQEKGMGLLYLGTMRIWLRDDDADLSKTMAGLDRGLVRIDGIFGLLCRGSVKNDEEQEEQDDARD